MKHIVLAGDSIFDNASYVEQGESVIEHIAKLLEETEKVTLLAVDGDITTDVDAQLEQFPQGATHLFVSCGGNDALRIVSVLDHEVESVGDGLYKLYEIREQFRINYKAMLDKLLENCENLAVCTVYNSVPGISERALTALALFNEIILEEASLRGLAVIDLRNLCREESDYSIVSPIEPSGAGAKKIAASIYNVSNAHDYNSGVCKIYI